MEPDLLALLNADLAALDITIPPGADAGLLDYLDRMLLANEVMNLTAITNKTEAVHKHLVDSLSVLLLTSVQAQLGQSPSWIDVGSGAGLPGMALSLAVPSATLHLIESTGKKAHFLNTVSAELGLLKRVKVYCERAEVLAQTSSSALRMVAPVPRGTEVRLRNTADGVFFRGVSKLASLIELGAPLLKVNGILLAYKGPKAGDELLEAAKAMKELKMELVERKDFVLPGGQEARILLCLKKLGETPKRFPRLTGLAQKEPLI